MNKLIIAWQWLISNWSKIVWTTLLLLILITYKQCESNKALKKEVEIAQKIADRNLDNYVAELKDSIETERNANNALIQKIRSIVLEKDDVEQRNLDLLDKYKESLNINNELKSINTVISAELEIKDSILNSRSFIVYDNNNIQLRFDEVKKINEKNIRTFTGTINLGIENDTLKILNSKFDIVQALSLKAGIIEENGYNVLKITSGSPDVLFTQIENISVVNEKLNPQLEPGPKLQEVKRNMFALGINNKIYFDSKLIITPAASLFYSRRFGDSPFFFNAGVNLPAGTLQPQFGAGILWSPKWMSF